MKRLRPHPRQIPPQQKVRFQLRLLQIPQLRLLAQPILLLRLRLQLQRLVRRPPLPRHLRSSAQATVVEQ